jgi:hypothetical protein
MAVRSTKASRAALKSKAAGMSINVKVEGLTNAEEMILFLHNLGANGIGAILHGRKREGGKGTTNADVIRYLAAGVTRGGGETGEQAETIRRDLGPTQQDSDSAGVLYMQRVRDRLQVLTYRLAKQNKMATPGRVRKLAEAASTSGLRAAANHVRDRMRRRCENQLTVHTGSESSAASVEQERYARRRKRLYGVGALAVYKATGQLLANLSSGSVRIVKQSSVLSQAGDLMGESLSDAFRGAL